MKTYAEFRPTGFDAAGLGCHDRQDWLVGPVSRTRDSGCLDESNFHVFAAMLKAACGDEGEESGWEIHRFGHWGPGWFEIFLLAPGSMAADIAEETERKLDNYPVLSDDDFSEREFQAAAEAWARESLKHRLEAVAEHNLDPCRRCGWSGYAVSPFVIRRDELPSELFEHYRPE